MMQDPVSVIIPTYNRERFVTKAVDSVREQTYGNFELIVVDDGSTDNTQELLAGYGKDIVCIRQENRGPASARNTGIKAARHDLIAFLDSDDWFDRKKLEIQTQAMGRAPSFLISHTEEIWYRRERLLNQKKKHHKSSGNIFARCLELCAVGMSTVMVRKELFDRVGLFDEGLRCCEDYDLWLRTSIDHKFLLIDSALTFKQGGREDQVSFRYRTGMDRLRIKSILKILESWKPDPDQTRLAKKELVKKCLIYGKGCIKHGRAEEGAYFLQIADLNKV
ncbi:MAG: glycosyltransferase family A protein [Thermodesulfobacteriota bacterium]|nr:glycosyltransferase family A protein [Thermodesulfobacteriota bacterium]